MKKKKQTGSSKKQLIVTLAAAVALTTLPAGAWADVAVRAEQPIPAISEENVQGLPNEGGEEAPADVAVSRDKAIELSKQLVKIPADYTLQSASYNTERLAKGTRSAWNLSFVKRVNNKHLGSIQTRIDAGSGELLGYNTYLNDPAHKPAYPPKVDREQAQELAEAFIAEVGKSYAGELRYNVDFGIQFRPPLNGEVRHQLRYNRVVNDIAYMDNFVDVEVDGEGHIMGYQVQWDKSIAFEEGKPSITLAEAEAEIRELAQPRLSYVLPYQMKPPVKPFLSYEMEALMIDALTGERYQPFAVMSQPNTTDPVAPAALGTKPAANKSLTSEQAVKAVSDAFKLPADSKLTDSSYHEYNHELNGRANAVWQLSWAVTVDGKENGSIWATVNSRTGEVTSYYSRNNSEVKGGDEVKIVTYEQAKATALATVKKLLPGYANELYLQETDRENYDKMVIPGDVRDYNFRFQRQIHGAAVQEGVHVSVNAISNEVSSYNGELGGYQYPAQKPQTISEEQAVDAFMDYYNLELTYVQTHTNNDEPISIEKYNLMVAAGVIVPGNGGGEGTGEAKLVYRLVQRPIDGQVFLDAESGEWRDYQTGDVTSLIKETATDIAGHWAERELSMMVAYKALDLEDGKVRPQAIVTRGEMIKMLVLSMSSGYRPMAMGDMANASFADVGASSEYFIYVENAVQANLIDLGDGTFNPEGEVDREEMSELIVRALGYNTLAKYEGLFNIPFNDTASIDNKGQAAIVAGLKIMNPDEKGNFNPDRLVTRAESATAFFRFLQAKADLQEAPLRN